MSKSHREIKITQTNEVKTSEQTKAQVEGCIRAFVEHLNNLSAGYLENAGNSSQTFVRFHVQLKQHGEVEGQKEKHRKWRRRRK